MEFEKKRIYLQLNPRKELHRKAIEKISHYDQKRYTGMTDYIVQAINAYEAPITVGGEELRKILREELGILPRIQERGDKQEKENRQEWQPEPLQQNTEEKGEEEKEPRKTEEAESTEEAEQQEDPVIDEEIMAFMKETGVI